ncbi:hypothetical protein TREMEDRAFT_58794 [Tremella mesenterica DSM 1558]|uniref:uncharacterized protein n=1 Tax=Tremella mesenterica (strain ATCC 24925 / CBS 8224 / DSM 1558 / NBRC 9311 / NRRL Y-6157 / RJB 2259-6 / UBC 559-6) TaxID=578456 RepID=UPI0003F48E0A|nr:uncharacterized protein TREMEDRAFT_58794 [Tremella mesenterica DSM 1558]EIW72624.1 hypothetical protein TREMEDRAFT_58794 [Tremella mesenterica DSM 1558]
MDTTTRSSLSTRNGRTSHQGGPTNPAFKRAANAFSLTLAALGPDPWGTTQKKSTVRSSDQSGVNHEEEARDYDNSTTLRRRSGEYQDVSNYKVKTDVEDQPRTAKDWSSVQGDTHDDPYEHHHPVRPPSLDNTHYNGDGQGSVYFEGDQSTYFDYGGEDFEAVEEEEQAEEFEDIIPEPEEDFEEVDFMANSSIPKSQAAIGGKQTRDEDWELWDTYTVKGEPRYNVRSG